MKITHRLFITSSSTAWFIDSKFVKGFDGVMERLLEFLVVFVPNRNHKCLKACHGLWKLLSGIGHDEFGAELFLAHRRA